MTGDDRFRNAVVVERFSSFGEKGLAIVHTPLCHVLLGAYIFPVAPDEQRQLQRRARPLVGARLADVTAGIGKGQRMCEIKPADIIGNRVVGGALECGIEM